MPGSCRRREGSEGKRNSFWGPNHKVIWTRETLLSGWHPSTFHYSHHLFDRLILFHSCTLLKANGRGLFMVEKLVMHVSSCPSQLANWYDTFASRTTACHTSAKHVPNRMYQYSGTEKREVPSNLVLELLIPHLDGMIPRIQNKDDPCLQWVITLGPSFSSTLGKINDLMYMTLGGVREQDHWRWTLPVWLENSGNGNG